MSNIKRTTIDVVSACRYNGLHKYCDHGADSMYPYNKYNLYIGDLHNHCNISYGKGDLSRAYANARQQLDFCSVTGHALWPDMPQPDGQIDYLIDFHKKGFTRVRNCWDQVKTLAEQDNVEGEFVTFLGFECHNSAYGDYTVVFGDGGRDIIEASSFEELISTIRRMQDRDEPVLAFPHHTGYKQGYRGINWKTFDEKISPVVEMISMHGCSEHDDSPRPYLHGMGPLDHSGTMVQGLSLGHRFGVIGSTDHHSAHPGSFGQGRTALWATAKTRKDIWDAIVGRRTYALTGDNIMLKATCDDVIMGGHVKPADSHRFDLHVIGGGAIDYVDIVRDGHVLQRFSQCDMPATAPDDAVHTKVFFEVGWGASGRRQDWQVDIALDGGSIIGVEPRFRGPVVLSPLDHDEEAGLNDMPICQAHHDGGNKVHFTAITHGNPNCSTPATQGICLELEAAPTDALSCTFNGIHERIRIGDLLAGAYTGRLGKDDSAAYRIHKAPQRGEYEWSITCEDRLDRADDAAYYYIRVRQQNDQWAWSSPFFIA